ncbi:MAG TPA: hypothetical protein VGN42_19395 [Pirellulales bacterium]|jgi:predicted RNase H-like nuclease|nr:hypothetical protein [Pirellulales bacterium]
MSTSGKTKANQQTALAADVAQIMSELHRLAAANARSSAAKNQGSHAVGPALVIRGK